MSAILSADDLNDFISPGAACIKPVTNLNESNNQDNENGEVEIQIDDKGNPLEISKIDGKVNSLSPAQISLADCLACSGCITSAEEILVAQHSHDELIKAIRDKVNNNTDKVFVASISHQARASLATAYNISIEDIDRLLINLFINQMGFTYIVGTSLGRKLSLIYEAQNIIQRKHENHEEGPVLSSICPGWVLYAEKTHPYILPRISNVKSPQQITGCLLKTLTANDLQIPKDKIYHLSIMPCFDKKLESARPEHNEETPSVDVDCVLTPKELVTLLEEHKSDFQLIPENTEKIVNLNCTDLYSKCAPPSWPFVTSSWSNDSGSASGGYGFNYLKMVQNDLCLKDPNTYQLENFTIDTINGKNSDIYELRLLYNQTKVASTAIVNGFKNIQNLVRKLKPSPVAKSTTKTNPLVARRRARMSGKSNTASEESADASKCDYVEIMACPNGCINGGGQIAPPKDFNEKEWLNQALINYNDINLFDITSFDNAHVVPELVAWCQEFCKTFGINQDRLLKTWFNEVEQPTDPNAILLGAKW